MHVKFYAQRCEYSPGNWEVLGDKGGRTFLIDTARSKPAALRLVRAAERTALFCGATVIA